MNTIGNYIRGIASRYTESNDQTEPQLTEMDFLAGLAMDRVCGTKFTRYTIDCISSYNDNQDEFIDYAFGKQGSTQRVCYEAQAKALYRLAMRFIDSTDEVSYNHQYLHDSRKIEESMCF